MVQREGTRNRQRLALAAVAALSACAAPTVRIEAESPATRLFVDGTERGVGALALPLPYYGTIDAAAVPPVPSAPVEVEPPPIARAAVRLDEPATPWIFPFDLLVEIAVRATAATADTELQLRAAAPPALAPGVPPPRLAELRARGALARTER